MSAPLSPTARTTIRRGKTRSVADRELLHAFLAEALVAHVGVVVDGCPRVLPTAFAVDPAGPDEAGTLYLHGSVAADWLRKSVGHDVCVTVTELDGFVAARSAFHHSMNYRSAVIIGRARIVDDEAELLRALELTIDHMIPGRWRTLRPSTRKELAATAVLAVPLAEASMKQRAEGPVDDPADVEAVAWGGHIPIRRVAGPPIGDDNSRGEVPADVRRRSEHLGSAPAVETAPPSSDTTITLCCQLWAHAGQVRALTEYENTVLALLPDHGGTLLNRVAADGIDGRPDEIQLIRFTTQAGLDGYLADPRRTVMAADRDRAIARTETLPVGRV
ncbi:MAG: pyridoxamine 5'-phosphate oxidase family protein [Gordonia amarae]